MKTTLIGHACLLFESRDTTLLSDPCLFSLHFEELNYYFPRVDIQRDKFPRPDAVYLSHRHQDHFDVRTLAYLKRNDRILKPNVRIMAPNDPILLEVLKELEFENVEILADFEPIPVKDVIITPTPSLNQSSTAQDYFPEHGLLVHDGQVTAWNQVDTIVSPEIIDHIGKIYGGVDFAHSRFLPLLEGHFTYHKPVVLPFDEYCSFLNAMRALAPKFVVPGSAAFRYRDEFTFMNHYTFPTTQEQFLCDLLEFCPEIKSSVFLSGDVAHISPSGTRIESQGSDFVRTVEDDSHRVAFKPVLEVSPIRTQTADPAQHEQEMKVIRDFVENQYLDRLLKSEILQGWKHWKIVYQLEVFGQGGESEIWSIDFGQSELSIQKGSLSKINLYEGVASSELYALIQKTTSWDYVALCGNYRTFNNIYRITNGQLEYFPSEKINQALEPLMDAFPADLDMDREKFLKDVRRWKDKA